MTKHVILGSGAAGTKAAEEIRSLSPDDEIIVVTDDSHLPYYRYYLPDVVAGIRGDDKLLIHPPEFYDEQRIQLVLGRRAVSLSCPEKRVGLHDGSFLDYDKLLIATGSLPQRGRWPGSDLAGVFYLRNWDEMASILQHMEAAKTVVIAGGGLLGIELAWAFRQRGLAVTWLIRQDRFWPQMMDAPGSKIMEERAEAAGVVVRKRDEVSEIVGAAGRVVGIRTARGEEIPADIVGVAIGAVPSTAFLANTEVKVDRGVLVDEHLRSSVDDVYAAGDVAQVFDPVHGDYRVHTNWENGERQGRVAGTNMVGHDRQLEGGIDYNLMKLYDVSFVSMGLANPPADGYDILVREQPGKYRKLVIKDGKLVGATMLGEIKGQRAAYDLIVGKIDVSAADDRLTDPSFSLASLVPKKAAGAVPS